MNKEYWIPCSKKLPKPKKGEYEETVVTYRGLRPDPMTGKYIYYTSVARYYNGVWWWYEDIEVERGWKIVAWAPLPEPYQEEG